MGHSENRIQIGCIADDFTGASDIGSFLDKGGLNTLLINGIPNPEFEPDESVQAIVIALKSRSIEKSAAVRQSLAAHDYLNRLGCRQVYFKFCSTFDSTPEGNIGPVVDALMEATDSAYTIICPSLPVNGRKVRNGGLYVHDVPLHESPMKDHPVNPMWDYKISRLMEPQGRHSCLELSGDVLELGNQEIMRIIDEFRESNGNRPFYIIPDYFEDRHGERIADLFQDIPFVSGGSGLADSLASIHRETLGTDAAGSRTIPTETSGRSIIFAGSCSTATRGQIGEFLAAGGKAFELDAGHIAGNPGVIDDLRKEIRNPEFTDLLIHTSGNGPGNRLNADSNLSQERISELYETSMADLAETALKSGINRIIIAGGETSGAVTERLGFHSFYLGDSVAPGVPVLAPVENTDIRLVLKSGNFGPPDFFFQALRKTGETGETGK